MKVDMSEAGVTGRLREMDELWVLSSKLMNAAQTSVRPYRRTAARALEIYDSIRQVLLREWDPIGVANEPGLENEYDGYIGPVYRMLAENRKEEELANLLIRFECDSMGLIERSPEQVRPAVRKLLALDAHLDG